MLSVNTNVWAMSALATLNAINRELAVVQSRITTGLRVASAKDDPSTWRQPSIILQLFQQR